MARLPFVRPRPTLGRSQTSRFLLIVFLTGQPLLAAELLVPRDHATIQAAIDAAVDGDTILVAPGVYEELLNYHGKAITVRAVRGPRATVIDGAGSGPIVTFNSGEPRESVLEGFTIRRGFSVLDGGGIWIVGFDTSPTIRNNHIVENETASRGAGIQVFSGDPLIEGNLIARNTSTSTGPGGGGAGISLSGGGMPVVVGNEIVDNQAGEASTGCGIKLSIGGFAVIANNVIRGNKCEGDGGGIGATGSTQALVIQNLIVGNTARRGGGLYWLGGVAGPSFISNTVADNTASQGEVAYAEGIGDSAIFEGNLLVALGPGAAFECSTRKVVMPAMAFNDLYSVGGALFAGPCTSPIGTDGNVSVDPRIDRNYRLKHHSPVIDAGSPNPLAVLESDLAGKPRISDGDRDGIAVIDLGAYESPGPKH